MKELFFDSIGSTNSYLKDHYEELEDMTFVRAAYQSAGKGRLGRKWKAGNGEALMFSLLIRDEDLMERSAVLSVLSAYSVLKVLESYGIRDLSIKWPNDVYAAGRKICGILLEGVSREKRECLIIGIGINVKQRTFEGDYRHEPVSMALLLEEEPAIEEVRDRVYERLLNDIEELKSGKDLYPALCSYDYLKGKKAYALIDGVRKPVDILGIAEDYSLRVKDDGGLRKLLSDEITFHI